MAKYYKSTSPLAMGRKQKGSAAYKKKKKDDEKKAVASKPQSSVSQKERINQKSYGTTKPRTTQRASSTSSAQRSQATERNNNLKQERIQQNERNRAATSAQMMERREQARRQKTAMPTAEEQRRARETGKAIGRGISNSVKESMTADNAARMQRQKLGTKTAEDIRKDEERKQKRIEVAKNTGRAAKKGVQDTLTGYEKTLADVTEMTASNKNGIEAKVMKMGIDPNKDKKQMSDLEKERKKTVEESRKYRLDLAEKQEKRQKEFDEATKNAKGLEKAWYGAVESGTGMATDMAVGAVTGTGQVGALASMGIRTYGTTRGQAEKEGATENEDRLYSLLQAGKEVGTEMMFQGAGLAKSAFSGGKIGLSIADRVANRMTRNMTGRAADATAAGIKLLGGTAEENTEEFAGWLADPLLKEFTYGKNVRKRKAQDILKQESDELRSNITSEEEARSVAAYLSSDRFIEDNMQQYKEAGLTEAQAREVAEQMRDYLTASLTGDTEKMSELESGIVASMSGNSLAAIKGEYDKGELLETFASTSLLTLTTGLPSGISTAAKGSEIRENLGSEGLRALTETAINFEDEEASLKGEVARDRMDAGKEPTSTQVYELAQAQARQVEKDYKRASAASGAAETRIKDANYVAPEIQFKKDGSIAGDEVITQNYRKESSEAAKTINELMDQDGKESLTDTEVQNGTRAIAGFKTGAFTVADANALNYTNTTVREAFTKATGIDLNQYVVKDKNGNVDIPKTNAATKDALFAMASDNYVKTAEAETLNWMDKKKGEVVTEVTSRMGSKGSVALQAALDDVDERDRATYLMNANAADMMYQTARNLGTEWENVKETAKSWFPGISEDKLKDMYNAGLEDRAEANTAALGKQTKIGEAIDLSGEAEAPKGNLFIDTEYAPKGSVVRVFSEIASNLGVDIHLVDDLKTKTGNQANGQYINGAIYINVRSDFEKNVGYIFMHEVTHHLKLYAPEQFNALENLVRDKWFKMNPEEMQNEIAKRIKLYKDNNQNLTEEEALEEIIADAAHEFINDSNFAKQAAETEPSLAKAVLESIRNALRAIRRILALSNLDDETHMNTLFSQLGILDEAERLWLDAYTQAVKNKAAVGLVEWQEKANEESARHSISEPRSASARYEQGYKLTQKQFRSFYSAHKLNLRGQEDLDRQIAEIKENGFRSETALSNVMPVSTNDTIDPDNMNIMQGKYGVREGETVLLVPKTYVDKDDRIKDGFVPRDYEVVTAERDFQPYYELYSKAYDESQPARYSITTDKKDFVKGANLSKELRDWAKEVGLDKLSKQPVKGPVIVSVRDLRSAWYEKNGRGDEAEAINTALDKIGDSLTKLVGKYQYIDLGDAINAAVTYRTDAEGHPTSVILSCQVKNTEYEVNFDFTTICAKRLAMQKVLERFIKTEGERQGTTLYDELKLDEEGLYKLRLILETAGFDVSCRGCFVEQNRYSQQNQARTIANDWNAALDEWAKENETEVTENFGLTNLDIDSLDYEEIEAGFKRYHELMKGKKTDVATKNRMLIEASPFFRKRMNASDYASMAGQRALMAIGESKKGGTNLYGLLKRGQSDSKQSVPFTAYNGEISLLPDNMKGKSLYDYLLSIGGARAQSASDFQIEFVYDYMQMVADLSARGLPMHMYTKVIELAELFGMTGIKINLSAMCDVAEGVGGEYAGLKLVDGKYEYNISDQSIDYDKAVKLQKKDGYSKNIGIIMVTLSSQHMLKSLDDPDVRYIIGYHSSAMPGVVANMSNMGGATDYTKINKTNKLNEKGQALFDEAMKEAKGKTKLEKYKNALRIFDEKIQEETAKKKKKPRRGNEYGAYMSAYGNNTADFNTYDSLLKTKDARKTADKYLEHCMKNDLIPIYFPFAFHENYYKCEIYDFNMYDNNTGEYAPMESVQNIYPGLNMAAGETDTTAFMERVSQIMDEQNKVNKSLDSQYDAVFDEAKDELRYSITGDDYMDFDASGIEHSELTHRADAVKTEAQMRDDAYMDAVNSGNMEEAQRLVDEAAKASMPDTKFKGNWYHGTENEFTVFDFSQGGKNGHAEGFGIYITNDPEVSKPYGNRIIKGFANVTRPASALTSQTLTTEELRRLIKATVENEAQQMAEDYDEDVEAAKFDTWISNYTDTYYAGSIDKAIDEVIKSITSFNGNDMDIVQEIMTGMGIRNYDEASTFYDLLTETTGIDGFETKWGDEDEMYDPNTPTIGLAFRSSQIKSADPVTYAEDGSVIPLSERFDPNNNDIRYSLPTTDSDGKVLSDGQMEYFKYSQARDEQGRLQVMYHGTENAGFTVFNSDYGNSSRFFFFADSNDRAKGYSGTHDRFNATSYDSVDEANEYIKSWGNDDQVVKDEDEFIIIEDGKEILRNASLSNLMMEYDEYSGFGGTSANYEVYLNIERPLLINANGSNWDGITFNGDVVTTNWLAEYAYNEGYDGLIVDNVLDYGLYSSTRERVPQKDIIVFSSNQIKDTRNENPSENPDIRFSIVDDEEAKSQIAYEYAMDDSYEALVRYEKLIDEVEPETYHIKPFKEEDVAKFWSALKASEAVPSDDPYAEEDRVRIAKSKEEFFNSVNAKWQDRWTTGGEVLDVKSVRKDIRELVKGIMANSDTDAQYRNDIVRKTLMDVRTAYQLMKQDETGLASYLLYHSAQRMIDGIEFIRDDTAFKEYQEIRDFLRTYKVSVPEEYWQNEKFQEFRKEYRRRLKFVKGPNNIEDIYGDCESRWPHLFNETERENADLKDAPEDLLLHIGVVIDTNVTPFMEAYSSEEAASLATSIADELYEIMAGGREVRSLADQYKERYDRQTKAMKQRHAEAILRMRKAKEEGIKAEREKWRAREERRKERQSHRTYFERIQKSYDKLVERLTTNTKDKNIPEQYKKELAKLLSAFDLQTVGSKKREERTGHVAQKTIKMAAIREALKGIENRTEMFHINDAITDIIEELQTVEGQTIDELSVSELQNIDKMLRALLHEFNYYDSVRVGTKRQQAADIGRAQVDSALEHAKIFGAAKDYQNSPGWIDKIINLDEMTPAYMFRRIDEDNSGLGLMWKEIRRSFDKYVRNQNQLNDWMKEIVGKYHQKGILWNKYGAGELTDWRSDNYAVEFTFNSGTVKLTPAQMMSLYCLSKRPQAYQHMIGAGIVVAPVSFNAKILSDVKGKPNTALPVVLTDSNIKTIVAQLTPDQIKVADQLQELMATKMADWGNEASMDVLGIKLFNEAEYFPIKSDKAALEKDLNDSEFTEAIRNFGFTKAVQPGARNAIMIDDIFDVVTEHCNNMNLYNAYSAAINDFMKVYNYRDFREDGSEYTVQQAIAHAYSRKATTFIMTFLRDLNGNVSGRASGIEDAYNSMLGNAKKAAVFANLRVAAQQPTAITRAFAEIDPKYLKGIKVSKGAMKEMFEHCPIALWKSWGYYDINMGKSIEDIMMNNGRWLEDKATELYGKLDNVTWTAIWQMVKAEMKDKHPKIKEGTDEYWQMCNERMSDIVDFTQVVDSPMHRSHAMRDKGFLKKTATSFMAEPTLTFNMIRDGYVRAKEAAKKGDKALASKIIGRTVAVALAQAVAVAGAAGLIDALRHKNPDKDDEDQSFAHLWWVNFLNNFTDEAKIWNKVYFIKDIASIFEGWENSNLALQGIQKFALGYRQLTGDPYARSSASWWENMADGIGYMFGLPIKTVRTGLANAMQALGIQSPAIEAMKENLDSVAADKKDEDEVGAGGLVSKVVSDSFKLDGKGLLGKFVTKTSSSDIPEPEDLSDEEVQEARDDEQRLIKIAKSAKNHAGDSEALWDAVSDGYTKKLQEGDYEYIDQLRDIYIENGGDEDMFDAKVINASKSALKKSISYEQSLDDIWAQDSVKAYLINHGVTEQEISQIAYKSDAARDLKVALKLGDEDLIRESLQPLIEAGLSREDFDRLWDNRNRMDMASYKATGRYKDKLKSTGNFIWPTNGTITSHFGYRNSPTAGASSNHPAIDIGAPQGTAVVAADGGVVVYAGKNSGYGNSVGIKHDNGMVTYYNHLYSWNVKVGDTVGQGQQIAQVGSTGISTGPHLDFKILDADGNPVDPEKYLQKRS